MSPTLYGSFALYSVFVFYQQLHSKTFRGANEFFGLFLALFALAATLSGLAFLLYYGYTVSWFGAFVLFAAGMVAEGYGSS
jgi:hypothetical protein